jgi:hypothetical protein
MGIHQASQPRNESKYLDGSLSVKNLFRWLSPSHQGRTTWWQENVELRRQIRRRASTLEIVITPPCQQKITEARLPPAWMSLVFT